MLLEKKALIEAKTSQGWTPLHFSCFSGCLDCVELLLENGADILAKTKV